MKEISLVVLAMPLTVQVCVVDFKGPICCSSLPSIRYLFKIMTRDYYCKVVVELFIILVLHQLKKTNNFKADYS